MKYPSIDYMTTAIEKTISIRKIWRCNAGWGMVVTPWDVVERLYAEHEAQFAERFKKIQAGERPTESVKIDPERGSFVEAYYDTLHECVAAEYIARVLGKPRPERGFLPGKKMQAFMDRRLVWALEEAELEKETPP